MESKLTLGQLRGKKRLSLIMPYTMSSLEVSPKKKKKKEEEEQLVYAWKTLNHKNKAMTETHLFICSSCHIYKGFLWPGKNTRHLLLKKKEGLPFISFLVMWPSKNNKHPTIELLRNSNNGKGIFSPLPPQNEQMDGQPFIQYCN